MITLETLSLGGKVALARALAQLEKGLESPDVTRLLDSALAAPIGLILGLTGPPGVGKSTLIDRLIKHARGRTWRVAVIAVDPSSRISGGALLGDRTRFTTDPDDAGVFVRSMAARDRLGGVAEITYPAAVLMRALYDLVIVETVGVGQSETQIADIADRVVFCAQPGSGDSLQFMKAGVMEIPDLILVTKADLEPLARRTLADLRGALSLIATRSPPEILPVSAQAETGFEPVITWIAAARDVGAESFAKARETQANAWADRHIAERFGSEGLAQLHQRRDAAQGGSPFTRTADSAKLLRGALSSIN